MTVLASLCMAVAWSFLCTVQLAHSDGLQRNIGLGNALRPQDQDMINGFDDHFEEEDAVLDPPMCNVICTEHGKCIRPAKMHTVRDPYCKCDQGWTGRRCESAMCDHITCYNGGRCVLPDYCECPSNWTGPECAKYVERPAPITPKLCRMPCRNGGTCVHAKSLVVGDKCECPSHWTGTHCETPTPITTAAPVIKGPYNPYCGPYKYHYTVAQECRAVGHYYHKDHSGLNQKKCEEFCDGLYRCNAINYSPKKHLGCVLRECGFRHEKFPPVPFPMPIGYNKDFVSYSKYQPDEIPECLKRGRGTYDTPNRYCGPYDRIWEQDYQFKYFTDSMNLLECEYKCDERRTCTGIHYNRNGNKCGLVRAPLNGAPTRGRHHPNEKVTAYSKKKVTGFRCIRDGRILVHEVVVHNLQ